MSIPDYTIIETENGPMLSHSRKSIYDVMLAEADGKDLFAICMIHGLNSVQVQVALDYIAQHRAELEAELPVIRRKLAERQAHYEAVADQIRNELAQQPMTQERELFYTRLAQSRQRRGENGAAHRSE